MLHPSPQLLRVLLILALAVPVQALAPMAAHGAERPIVFTQAPTGQSSTENVFTMNANGSALRRLTGDGRSSHAVMSPDGRWIAYAKTFSGQTDLMVMRANGTRKRRLTSTPRVSEIPTSWSANSRQIVITRESQRLRRKEGVFLVKRDGTRIRRLLNRRFSQADWSPVGRQLVAVRRIVDSSYQAYYQIVRMNVDGSGKRVLTGKKMTSLEPRWSPNGKKIVFQESVTNEWVYGRIWTMRAGGKGKRVLVETSGSAYYPSWSPDGRWVAYWTSASQSYPSSIFRVSVATGTTKRLRKSFTRSLAW